MVATRADENILSTDAGFQGRVRASLIAQVLIIAAEGWGVPFHKERAEYASQVLNSPDTYKLLFANSVATDPNVVASATEAGTVELTSGNLATQAALVSDYNLDFAISSQFNSFFRTPG